MNRLDAHQDQAGAWEVISEATGSLAFDIGANIGQASQVMAPHFTRVVALEPCVESFDIAEAEAPPNVTVLCLAAADHEGEMTLTETSCAIDTGQLTSGEGLAWGPVVGERTVPCVTVDWLTRMYGPPDFLKIDTEGAEIEVLRGAQHTLATHRPRIIVEVHRKEHGSHVWDLLPGYDLIELRHGLYVAQGGHTWLNHYWLWGDHG